jgi:hypothetical protein
MMLTTILTLLGGGLGGALRFVPEILKLFTEHRDREHEYRMTQLQLDIDKARAGQAIDLVHAQGEATALAGEMQAYIEALKGQGNPTGVAWVDALNASVRPVVTYWWMTLLTIYKVVMIIVATLELYAALKVAEGILAFGPALTTYADRVWTPQDAGILAMILGFWFVDRSIRKQQGR